MGNGTTINRKKERELKKQTGCRPDGTFLLLTRKLHLKGGVSKLSP